MYTFEKDHKNSYQRGKDVFAVKSINDEFTDDDLNMFVYVVTECVIELAKDLRNDGKISKKTFKKLMKQYKEITK